MCMFYLLVTLQSCYFSMFGVCIHGDKDALSGSIFYISLKSLFQVTIEI